MYTEPHPVGSRTLWMHVESPQDSKYLRLYPADNNAREFYSHLSSTQKNEYIKIEEYFRLFIITPNLEDEKSIVNKISSLNSDYEKNAKLDLIVFEQSLDLVSDEWTINLIYGKH